MKMARKTGAGHPTKMRLGRANRVAIEDMVELGIALLDMIEPDPDLEDNADDEPSLAGAPNPGVVLDAEFDESDQEPALGAPENAGGDQTEWAQGDAYGSEDECDFDGKRHDAESAFPSRTLGYAAMLEEARKCRETADRLRTIVQRVKGREKALSVRR